MGWLYYDPPIRSVISNQDSGLFFFFFYIFSLFCLFFIPLFLGMVSLLVGLEYSLLICLGMRRFLADILRAFRLFPFHILHIVVVLFLRSLLFLFV